MATKSRQVDDLTDGILIEKLVRLYRPLNRMQIARVVDLIDKLAEGLHGEMPVENGHWDRLTDDEAEFILPFVEGLNVVALAINDMPRARQKALIDKAKIAIYGKNT